MILMMQLHLPEKNGQNEQGNRTSDGFKCFTNALLESVLCLLTLGPPQRGAL